MNKLTKAKKINVFLKPCNEKQELNYFEDFAGTPTHIVNRSLEMIDGLKAVFPNGDFSVKIESSDLEQTLYLDSDIIFDKDFNEIASVQDFIKR